MYQQAMEYKFERLGSVSCGVAEHPTGNLVRVNDLINFINWLTDNEDIDVILEKLEETKDILIGE